MRLITIVCMGYLTLTSSASAQTGVSFHKGLQDCLALVTDTQTEFAQADDVSGSLSDGYLAWYHDDEGQANYGVRAGSKGDGADEVISCQGPSPMGPWVSEYKESHHPDLVRTAKGYGLAELAVPATGWYFADCPADTPTLLLAVTIDDTNRVGIQVVRSAGVAETCEKFSG
ncbi:MAG: hypothetical protein ACPGRD_06455 [Planktomarina sp.]